MSIGPKKLNPNDVFRVVNVSTSTSLPTPAQRHSSEIAGELFIIQWRVWIYIHITPRRWLRGGRGCLEKGGRGVPSLPVRQ